MQEINDIIATSLHVSSRSMSLRCLRACLCEDESVGVFEHKVHLFSNTEAPAYVHYGCRPAGIRGFFPLSTRRDTQPVHVALCWAPERGCQGSGEQSAFSLGLGGFLISCGWAPSARRRRRRKITFTTGQRNKWHILVLLGGFLRKYWIKIITLWLKLLFNHTSNIGQRLKC